MGELAEKLSVRSPTVTGLTNRLIKQRLIERLSDPGDRRIVRIGLTKDGRRVLGEIETASRAYLDQIFAKMGEEKVEELIRVLDGFTEVATAVQREGEFLP